MNAVLHTGNIPAANLYKELLTDGAVHIGAEAAIQILSTRCDELLDVVAERDRTIALQAQLIESQDKHPLPKIEPGDIDRIAELAQILRSDPRPIWGACIDSLERVLANVREA